MCITMKFQATYLLTDKLNWYIWYHLISQITANRLKVLEISNDLIVSIFFAADLSAWSNLISYNYNFLKLLYYVTFMIRFVVIWKIATKLVNFILISNQYGFKPHCDISFSTSHYMPSFTN